MTDEQMRIKIAEACGWKALEYEDFSKYGVPCFMLMGSNNTGTRLAPPDYLNDLNAMHEAESCFVGDASKAMTYAMHLLRACRLSIASEYDELNVDYCWHACHATTRQRAKAFLKTLNLWKD